MADPTPLADYMREQLAEGLQRRAWSEDAVMPWEEVRERNARALTEELDGTAEARMPWEPPSSFVFFEPPDLTPEERAVAAMRAAGAEHTGWPDAMPKPFEVNRITYRMEVSPQMLADAGIEMPEGYVPWQPPPIPWHRRIRNRYRHLVWRGRIRLANALAGFDVEERD